ncbi:penicillin-binding protein [Nocardioidaceae bacterium SCSIO 66511]|nr:penicillin-binding protein [Nocardioidaceae bacterium SCSIO 66511]
MSQSDDSSTPVDATPDDDSQPRKRKKQRKHPKLFAFFKWSAIAFTVFFVALVVGGYIFYRSVDIPSANAEFQTETTYVYYSDGKTVLGKFETQNRESVELDRIPQVTQAAAIAAEDRTFFENRGVDFQGILRAAMNNATSDSTQGASTITQQYVKILYLTQDQTYTRKLKEAVLSLKIHNQLSKDEILEGYLNTIYFGRGAYGIQTAARAFFDVDVEDLSLRQSAVLTSVLNNPSGYDPANGKEARQQLKERYDYVLDGMAEMGAIDEAKAEHAKKRLPKFPEIKTTDRFSGPKGYLLRMVEQELQKEGFSDTQINGGGLKVVTTFDTDDQIAARKSVREQQQATGLKEAAGKDGMQGLHIGLASVETKSGALRAMYGGPNYLKSQYNWAEHGAQPGSTFKPFALAAGLENGFSLQSSVDGSSPYYLPDGTDIENQGDSGGQSYGTISLENATEHSVNTAFIDLILQMEDGGQKTIDAARRAGVPVRKVFTRDQRVNAYPTTPLGYAPVSVIDMANSYATFGNEGQHNDWYVIESVDDPNGGSFQHEEKSDRAFSADVAADVTYALQQVVNVPGATGNSAATVCPTAGKTGTATASEPDRVSSSWFAGMSPRLSTAVMYVRGPNGNGDIAYRNDGSLYMPTFYGGDFPASTFQTYMNKVLEGEDCGEFPEPAYITADEGEIYTPPETTDDDPNTELDPTTDGGPDTDGPNTDDPETDGGNTDGPDTDNPETDDDGVLDPETDGPTDDGGTGDGPPETDGGDGGNNGNTGDGGQSDGGQGTQDPPQSSGTQGPPRG